MRDVRAGQVTVVIAQGDTLLLRDNASHHVTVIDGKRGASIMGTPCPPRSRPLITDD